MAVYTNLGAVANGGHGVFESSLLKSTLVGHIDDVLVVNGSNNPIDVDNGTPVVVGNYTGNGLQERTAKIAGVADKISVLGTVPLVKDAATKAFEAEDNFYNKAGKLSKAYEVIGDKYNGDIFGVSTVLFANPADTNIAVGNYVTVNASGKYAVQTTAPTAANVGFYGKIHSITKNGNVTLVRIYAIQNVDNNA